MMPGFIDVMTEEPSMEAFLRAVLPKLLGEIPFNVYPFQDKDQLLARLPARLRGLASWVPAGYQIVILVDRDDDECQRLKAQLEEMALQAGLRTRSSPRDGQFQVINRVVVEELEAWYFGDWDAVRAAYPRVSSSVPRQQGYRDPDAIQGGTWEHFERIMQRAGYFRGGLRKIEAAQSIGPHIDPNCNRSHSFQVFRDAIRELAER